MSIPNFDKNREVRTRYSRGTDNRIDSVPQKIGLETVDNAILKYLQQKIKPVVTQDNKQINVPILYGNPERWKSAQKDGAIRDQFGKIQLPVMMIRRTSMEKNSINSPVNKYNNYVYKMGWNARNIYDKFAALNGVVPSQQYSSVLIPDFYNIKYEAMVWTEYMEQMNSIIEYISFEDNEYWGEDNNYKFITTIRNYDQTTEIGEVTDRIVRNKFMLDVKAYILPESSLNSDGNRVSNASLQYSPKKVVFNMETVNKITK